MPHVGRSLENRWSRGESQIMVNGDPKRHFASSLRSRHSLAVNHNRQRHSKPVTRLPKFLESSTQNKGKVIPLSVLIIPSVFLTGCSLDISTPSFSWLSESFQNISTMFETLDAAAKEDLLHPQNHMNALMVWIFKMVSRIIYTPVFLFDNEFFHHLIRIFAGLSIGVVTIGSMVEGFKRVLGLSGSSFKTNYHSVTYHDSCMWICTICFCKSYRSHERNNQFNFYYWHQYTRKRHSF